MMRTSCDATQLKKVTGIYLIRNLLNNKIYIGQSTDIYRRWMEHKRAGQDEKYSSKNERDKNVPIHKAIKKYGIENFEISLLEECDKKDLNDNERKWIDLLKSNINSIGYNLTNGGQKNFALCKEKHSQAKLT